MSDKKTNYDIEANSGRGVKWNAGSYMKSTDGILHLKGVELDFKNSSDTVVFTVDTDGNVDITGDYLINGTPISGGGGSLDINALTEKTTPVDADLGVIADSAASFANKKVTWANIKATLKTYFDSLSTTLTNKTISGSSNTLSNIAQSSVTNLTTDLAAKEATANKDASGGYAGLTLLKINFKNVANTFTSFFTNTNTAARTYTFQDRDGTIIDNTNLVTGSTDNAILRADGTGGKTTQSSGVSIDDSNNIVLPTTAAGATTGIVYKGSDSFIHNYQPSGIATGRNLFIGIGAGNFTMVSGASAFYTSYNVGIGYGSLVALTTGYYNFMLGNAAGEKITTGSSNLGLGNFTLQKIVTASNNTAVGNNAGAATTGGGNTLVGANSGQGVYGSSTYTNTTAVGVNTGIALTTGANNVLFGWKAGDSLTTGGSNILIGYDVDASGATVSNELNIGNAIYGTSIGSTAKIGVNVAAPNSTLQVSGSVSAAYVAKTGAYTLTATDYTVDCTSGTFAITLPTAASITGRIYVINNSGSGTITINTTPPETINGAASGTITLTQYHSITVQSDGANWIKIAAI